MQKLSVLAISLAALACSAAPVLAQSQPDKASQSFIKSAIEANYSEIDVGKLAQEKGNSQAVKSYGQMLVDDHTDSNQKADQVAKDMNVTPPTGSGMSGKAEYLKLKVLSGDTFDRTFARDMVKDHQADIKDFQKEAQKSDAAGAFAKDTLPTLQKHLQAAQALTQKTTTGSK